jgi:hypothetical protein
VQQEAEGLTVRPDAAGGKFFRPHPGQLMKLISVSVGGARLIRIALSF